MNCDQVKELLVEYLLSELPEEDRSSIELHLRGGCPDCTATEKELALGIDILFQAIPNDEIENSQRKSILAFATSPCEESTLSRRTLPNPNSKSSIRPLQWFPYLLALAAGVLVMMTISSVRKKETRSGQSVQVNIAKSDTFEVDPINITHNSEMSDAKYAKTRLVSMERTNNASRIEGRILWDALSHEVHFFGRGIPTPPKGMGYVLWLMGDDDKTLVSKELIVNSSGLCKQTVSNNMGSVLHVFITLESKTGNFVRPSKNIELTLDAKRFNAFPL